MKGLLFALGVLAVTVGIGSGAEAQNYPWCAQYSKPGGTNCGFTTFEQCMATVSGIGGFCDRNTLYQPGPAAHRSYRAHKRASSNHS